ncbi:MAG: hypothetical protein ACYCS2_01860, partial [Acidimicrobiales bacterium]
NFLEPDPDDTHLHHRLPLAALMDHAESAGLLRYRLYHGRSHFVVYRSRRTDRSRLMSGTRRRAGVALSGPKWWRTPGAYGGKAWI